MLLFNADFLTSFCFFPRNTSSTMGQQHPKRRLLSLLFFLSFLRHFTFVRFCFPLVTTVGFSVANRQDTSENVDRRKEIELKKNLKERFSV